MLVLFQQPQLLFRIVAAKFHLLIQTIAKRSIYDRYSFVLNLNGQARVKQFADCAWPRACLVGRRAIYVIYQFAIGLKSYQCRRLHRNMYAFCLCDDVKQPAMLRNCVNFCRAHKQQAAARLHLFCSALLVRKESRITPELSSTICFKFFSLIKAVSYVQNWHCFPLLSSKELSFFQIGLCQDLHC